MLDHIQTFQVRTRVLLGKGGLQALGEVARELGCTRYLLVADPSMRRLGHLDTAHSSLRTAGLDGEDFDEIEPEPYLDGADAAAKQGRQADVNLVVGIGGGSALDTAKAAAALVVNGGLAESYVGLNLVPGPGLPTIMVPTTAGTGAEVTFTAVFTNRATNAKGGINSPHLFPDVALLDPELTVSLPPEVTAATGIDALTHAIESVTGRACTVFTEALGLAAIRLLGAHLRRAVYHGDDLQAREMTLKASLLAGLALADAGVGACHALAYPLGGTYRIPHGLANAMLIPHVMEFNLPAAEEQFRLIAESMGVQVAGANPRDSGRRAVDAVATLCRDIGIPLSLESVGVARADVPALVEIALKVARPVENNPRTLRADDAIAIYEKAFS